MSSAYSNHGSMQPERELELSEPLSLYIHIPFCDRICHYCDFAKTANFNNQHIQIYMEALEAQLSEWLTRLRRLQPKLTFDTVFFGGGTPSLLKLNDYKNTFEVIEPFLSSNAEVSLEANPNHCTPKNIGEWHALGINRISIGVQSFKTQFLTSLFRNHDPQIAKRAIDNVINQFEFCNIDLIYGIPNQTLKDWEDDLRHAVELNVPHLSLYNLTYEPGTVLGRKSSRGKIAKLNHEIEEQMYSHACDYLGTQSFVQEEVSNWALEGNSCHHNWKYWKRKSFLGLGAGAFGYFETKDGIGYSYNYSKNSRFFHQIQFEPTGFWPHFGNFGELENNRTKITAVIELVASGLRTNQGIALKRIEAFYAYQEIERILSEIQNELDPISIQNGFLKLDKKEWFRENYWAEKLLDFLV